MREKKLWTHQINGQWKLKIGKTKKTIENYFKIAPKPTATRSILSVRVCAKCVLCPSVYACVHDRHSISNGIDFGTHPTDFAAIWKLNAVHSTYWLFYAFCLHSILEFIAFSHCITKKYAASNIRQKKRSKRSRSLFYF